MKQRIITIAGRPGSGKSSTAKEVAARLGYEHFSSGDLFRELGKQRGTEVLQTNLNAEKQHDPEVDRIVDGRLREIGTTKDNMVIDSRTAWHWIPDSFKVFLSLDLHTAAERILNDMDDERLANEHIHRDPDEYAQVLQKRLDSEKRRYLKQYGINAQDMSNYDLVIDTHANNFEQAVELVLKGYQEWLTQ
ncbi:MAG TPA: nucleoside monophosphate kinase [Patescibacteria group bacterium]|nr:nucleoside monophosphate kinase [Patescibacteria group bacterium]